MGVSITKLEIKIASREQQLGKILWDISTVNTSTRSKQTAKEDAMSAATPSRNLQ